MRAKTLPILLKNQKVLLIGGGKVALQKATVLNENEIEFKLISREFLDAFSPFECEKKRFELEDIGDFKIIIDATGSTEVAQMLIEYKKEHPVLLNVVDVPALCDFYFMALTKNRPLQIAVSSNGASPTAAQYFRDECEKLIPDDISQWLFHKQEERERGFIEPKRASEQLKRLSSRVYLVGCGVGDIELLTLKAYKIIQSVDVVLYDHLISEEIMQSVPKSTLKVYVGKQKDFHSKSQEEINRLIVKYAKEGLKVARLKSGDPFVFGRGAEELEELLLEGIKTEVIPGISSSISAPLLANIPVTARGYASGFSVVSAHLKGNSINLDWVHLLGIKNHSVVVLMGLSRVDEIIEEAKRQGINTDLPCAVVSNASRKNQKVLTSTLKNLQADAKEMIRPAILVFGEVVHYKEKIEEITNSSVTAA